MSIDLLKAAFTHFTLRTGINHWKFLKKRVENSCLQNYSHSYQSRVLNGGWGFQIWMVILIWKPVRIFGIFNNILIHMRILWALFKGAVGFNLIIHFLTFIHKSNKFLIQNIRAIRTPGHLDKSVSYSEYF